MLYKERVRREQTVGARLFEHSTRVLRRYNVRWKYVILLGAVSLDIISRTNELILYVIVTELTVA